MDNFVPSGFQADLKVIEQWTNQSRKKSDGWQYFSCPSWPVVSHLFNIIWHDVKLLRLSKINVVFLWLRGKVPVRSYDSAVIGSLQPDEGKMFQKSEVFGC